jgi:hypothetical protein
VTTKAKAAEIKRIFILTSDLKLASKVTNKSDAPETSTSIFGTLIGS